MTTPITPLYTPGDNFTGRVTGAAVVAGRFVMIAGPKVNGEALPVKLPTGSTVPCIGVTMQDGAVGAYVGLYTDGHVVPVEVGSGGVAAGDVVQVGTDGRVTTRTSTNVGVGLAFDTHAAGEFAFIQISPGL